MAPGERAPERVGTSQARQPRTRCAREPLATRLSQRAERHGGDVRRHARDAGRQRGRAPAPGRPARQHAGFQPLGGIQHQVLRHRHHVRPLALRAVQRLQLRAAGGDAHVAQLDPRSRRRQVRGRERRRAGRRDDQRQRRAQRRHAAQAVLRGAQQRLQRGGRGLRGRWQARSSLRERQRALLERQAGFVGRRRRAGRQRLGVRAVPDPHDGRKVGVRRAGGDGRRVRPLHVQHAAHQVDIARAHGRQVRDGLFVLRAGVEAGQRRAARAGGRRQAPQRRQVHGVGGVEGVGVRRPLVRRRVGLRAAGRRVT